MAEWTIYGKNGVAKATVKELELHDEWMAECFLTVTVKSAEPVSFAVGDYLDYRDERYTINYDPSVVKKARCDTYGEGFVYDNIKFVSVQDEIVRCDFNDIVLSDNKMHYTSLPTFPFYCETVDDLLDRIQANLEELYPGEWTVISPMLDRDRQRGLCVGREQAFINAYNEYIGGGSFSYDKTGVSITVDNINCWEAMKYVNDSFGLNFIVRGRVVIVGTVGVYTSKTFRYGKGNGLYELERISDSEQRIITRLRGYGAETNLPTRFYATLNQLPFAVVDSVRESDTDGDKPFIDFNIDLIGSSYWTYQAYLKLGEWTDEQGSTSLGYLVTMRCGGYDVIGRVFTGYNLVRIYMEYSDTDDRTPAGVPVSVSDKDTAIGFINAIHRGVHVYFLDRIKLGAFDKEHLEGSTALPDNMAVNRLMLPGFPTKSLAQWVEEHDEDPRIQAMIEEGFTFSTDPLRPYIDSPNKEYIGLRPGSLYFDGSNENEDIHPTIEGMEWEGERCDVILDAEKIQDNGVLADDAKEEDRQVKVILPYGGFALDELKTDETTIEIKDGMCGARSLKVKSVSKTDEGNWECVCERDYDDTLHLYFPYSDFQIIRSASEPVHYVLTGIELPNSYVEAASEKLFYACVDALKQNHSPRFTFQPRIDELWMARQHDEATAAHQRSLHDTLKAGDIFVFTDEDLGIEGRIIIDILTIKENGNNGIPTYEVTLRDEKVTSTIEKRLDKVTSAVNAGLGGGGGYSGRQTGSLIESLGSQLFLSKIYDDEAQGVIGFLKGAWFGAKQWMIDALGNATLNNVTFSGILRGGQAVINKIKSSNYTGDGMLDTGWQIINDYEGSNSKAVFDYLYVRKKAIFEELEIRKMSYIGGNFVFSPASGRIWRVEAYRNYQIKYDSHGEQYIEVSKDDLLGYSEVTVPYTLGGTMLSLFKKLYGRLVGQEHGRYLFGRQKLIARKFTPEEIANMRMVRCYLYSDDGSTETMNWWKVGAQARCQTFNIESQVKWDGERYTGEDVANTYWWRLVSGTGRGLCDDGETHEYLDFLIKTGSTEGDRSVADADSDVPMVGDSMVQMGHRTNPQYANVIMMETVGGDAPAFKEYRGIMGWDLTGKQKTKISPTTGTVMYSTAFHIETEYGDVLVPKDRGAWQQGMTCYYYDRVEWGGSLWLCITPEGTTTTIEPGDSTPAQLAVWQKQVSKGDKGETSFKSNVFKRATSKPSKPANNDGSFANPVPSGWSDGVPSGTDTIWMTTRIFSSDGQAPQQASWTDVQLMSDTESFDVEFAKKQPNNAKPAAPNGHNQHGGDQTQIWFDPTLDPSEDFTNMYWMAERTKNNGVWGSWQITLIKGEKGDNAITTILKYTGPLATGATAPTIANYRSFTWTDNIPVQTEAKPNVYVGVWEITAGETLDINTQVPKSVTLFAHYGKTGDDGKNGTSIVAAPNAIVINQQKVDGGAQPLTNVSYPITVVARDSGTIVAATISNLTTTNCTASVSQNGTTTATVTITAIDYTTDDKGVKRYKTSGAVSFKATAQTAAGQTFTADISVPFGCNLLGQYTIDIEEDVKTEIASKVTAEITKDGVLTTTNFDNKYENASWGVKQDITKTINELKGDGTYDRSTGYSNSRLSTAEGDISKITKTLNGQPGGLSNTRLDTAESSIQTLQHDMYDADGNLQQNYSTKSQTADAISLKVNEVSQTLIDTALGSSGSWEQGGIGNNIGSTYDVCKSGHSESTYIRTKSITPMTDSFKVIINAGYTLAVYKFGADEKLLRSRDNITGSTNVTLESDVEYIALELRKTSGGTITPDDVVGNFVTAAQLSSCGIDIGNKTITMNADNMKFQMTSGDSAQLNFDLVNSNYVIGGYDITNNKIGSIETGDTTAGVAMYSDGHIYAYNTGSLYSGTVLNTTGNVVMRSIYGGYPYSIFSINGLNASLGSDLGGTVSLHGCVNMGDDNDYIKNAMTFRDEDYSSSTRYDRLKIGYGKRSYQSNNTVIIDAPIDSWPKSSSLVGGGEVYLESDGNGNYNVKVKG